MANKQYPNPRNGYRYKEKNVTGSYTELNSGFIYIIPQMIKGTKKMEKPTGKTWKNFKQWKM